MPTPHASVEAVLVRTGRKLERRPQVLHDAFFKWQTKPLLSTHGELYFEGKEFEVHLKEKRPGTPAARGRLVRRFERTPPTPRENSSDDGLSAHNFVLCFKIDDASIRRRREYPRDRSTRVRRGSSRAQARSPRR